MGFATCYCPWIHPIPQPLCLVLPPSCPSLPLQSLVLWLVLDFPLALWQHATSCACQSPFYSSYKGGSVGDTLVSAVLWADRIGLLNVVTNNENIINTLICVFLVCLEVWFIAHVMSLRHTKFVQVFLNKSSCLLSSCTVYTKVRFYISMGKHSNLSVPIFSKSGSCFLIEGCGLTVKRQLLSQKHLWISDFTLSRLLKMSQIRL